MPGNAEIAKDAIEQFKKIQDFMMAAKKENATETIADGIYCLRPFCTHKYITGCKCGNVLTPRSFLSKNKKIVKSATFEAEYATFIIRQHKKSAPPDTAPTISGKDGRQVPYNTGRSLRYTQTL